MARRRVSKPDFCIKAHKLRLSLLQFLLMLLSSVPEKIYNKFRNTTNVRIQRVYVVQILTDLPQNSIIKTVFKQLVS